MNRLESPKLGKFLFFFFEAPRENGKFPGKYQKWRHLARVQNCSSSFSYSGEMSTALYRALRERSLGHVRTLQRGVGKKESCKSSFEVRALAQSSVGALVERLRGRLISLIHNLDAVVSYANKIS